MNNLTKQSSNAEVRTYFEAVVKLNNSNSKFPVSLNDVWMLEYARKDNAVKELKKSFMEGIDYEIVRQKAERQIIINYKLTSSCLEYFIARKNRDVFNIYREVFHRVNKQLSRMDILTMAIESEKEVIRLNEITAIQASKITEDKPRVVLAKAIEDSSNLILIKELANKISQNGIDIGQNSLFKWMRDNGFLCKTFGERYNTPTQKSMKLNVMKIVTKEITNKTKGKFVVNTVKITGKGQKYFVNKFIK